MKEKSAPARGTQLWRQRLFGDVLVAGGPVVEPGGEGGAEVVDRAMDFGVCLDVGKNLNEFA